MTRILAHDGLARTLVSGANRHGERILVPSSRSSSSVSGSGSGPPPPSPAPCASGGGQLKSCATATMLQTLTSGLAAVREPW